MKAKAKKPDRFYVQIIKDATNHCHWQMGPMSAAQARNVRDGANINLNHAEWHVTISTTKRKVYT